MTFNWQQWENPVDKSYMPARESKQVAFLIQEENAFHENQITMFISFLINCFFLICDWYHFQFKCQKLFDFIKLNRTKHWPIIITGAGAGIRSLRCFSVFSGRVRGNTSLCSGDFEHWRVQGSGSSSLGCGWKLTSSLPPPTLHTEHTPDLMKRHLGRLADLCPGCSSQTFS